MTTQNNTNMIEMGKCMECKEKDSVEGLCSRTSSPYCMECHNKRSWLRRHIEVFTKGVIAWKY